MADRDVRWKWLLLGLCTLGLVALLSQVVDDVGLGSAPWFGFWDDTFANTSQPYVVAVYQPRPGGASYTAGLRDGDRVDLREQSLDARVAVLWQLVATRPTRVVVHRDARIFTDDVTGSTIYGGAWQWKAPNFIVRGIAFLWMIGIAFFIALRRWWSVDGRLLVAYLVCISASQILLPNGFAWPDPYVTLSMYLVASAAGLAASWLVIALCARYGERSRRRTIVEWLAYASTFAAFVVAAVGVTAILTLWSAPRPWVNGLLGIALSAIANLFVTAVAALAVSGTPPQERARAAWLLLPLPVSLLGGFAIQNFSSLINSWYLLLVAFVGGSLVVLLGAFLVSYALFSRRIFDAGFLISRTIVVSAVSLIVVTAFVLLEWALGALLTDASHATGLLANGALALALGLSLRFIHRRVDHFVDTVMFRKRHEDERALRNFSKEAAFVTTRDALLDRTMECVREHTDASAVAILLDDGGTYRAVRRLGETTVETDANDAAILALKATHAPLDPHAYTTTLAADLALPMVARGQLLGVLLCGQRDSGEAYAPDEIEALREVAHGVGSALGALEGDGETTAFADLRGSIVALREIIERRLPEPGTERGATI